MKRLNKTLFSVFFVIATLISLVAISSFSTSAKTTKTNTINASPAYICGDVDLDGTISVFDATLIQRYLAELDELDYVQIELADCENSLGIQIFDAAYIQKYVAQFDTDYPVNASGYKIGDVITFRTDLL